MADLALHKELARTFLDLVSSADVDAMAELITSDWRMYGGPPGPATRTWRQGCLRRPHLWSQIEPAREVGPQPNKDRNSRTAWPSHLSAARRQALSAATVTAGLLVVESRRDLADQPLALGLPGASALRGDPHNLVNHGATHFGRWRTQKRLGLWAARRPSSGLPTVPLGRVQFLEDRSPRS